jgi:hypothetical protein
MKKFIISAAVIVGVTVLAVLILNVVECQKDGPDLIPDATVTTQPSVIPTKSTSTPNVYALIQMAESGSVKSSPDGRYLLSLSGVKDSVKSEDGKQVMTLDSYIKLVFEKSDTARGVLDFDDSRGPIKVRLSSPERHVTDGGIISMSYVMEIVEDKQVLSKFEKPTLQMNPTL